MSYADKETSQGLGAPVEYHEYTMGTETWRYCAGDLVETVLGHEYTPEALKRTALDFSDEDSAGNISVRMRRDNPVALLFRAYVPPTAVGLTIYRKHRSDPEVVVAFVGSVIGVQFEGAEAVLTCAPISQAFGRMVPVLKYQSQCNHPLYGPGCGIDKATFGVEGTLTDVTGLTLTAAAWSGQADGWFLNGWVERATGERRFIVGHVGSVLTVMNPFPDDLAPDEVVTAYAGCDRTEATCAAKFDNLLQHLGWCRIPQRNPYGGGSIA